MRSLAVVSVLATIALTACGPDLQGYATCNDDCLDAPEDDPPTLTPELLVPNVDIGVEWYRDVAGFEVFYNASAEHSCFASVKLGDAEILLSHRGEPFDPPDDALEFRFLVDDVDAMNERFKDKGATFVREIENADYGLREFEVRDVYGFRLRFATPI
jgi:uncharacterized glyoxalase superfamily protein PhnB